MGEDYTKSSVYISPLLQEVLVKKNRQKRLCNIAESYFNDLEEKKKKTRRTARQSLQNVIVCAKRRLRRELLRLRTAFCVDYANLRCGIPQEEDADLERQLTELYGKRRVVKDAEIGWLKDGVSVLHEIDGTGFTLFGGNLQEIGKSKEGRSALLDQLDSGSERKEGKREVLNEVKAVLDGIPSDAFVREKWVERKKPGRKRKTIKMIRSAVGYRANPCPYTPMTRAQHAALYRFYTRGKWRLIRWRTILKPKQRIMEMKRLQSLVPARAKSVTLLSLQEEMSKAAALLAAKRMERRGLADQNEVLSICDISMYLSCCLISR